MTSTEAGGLEVRALSKSFEGGAGRVDVLREVGFEIGVGGSVAVTGPSGSGKSTLLHILGALDRPTSGTMTIAGDDPFALPEPELARFRNEVVGFVFQDHHLLPQYTVLENVLLPALAFGRAGEAEEARARELLGRVDLEARLAHRPTELSGGERQRAAVARALVNRPRLLLCDEPTGNLDGRTAGSVADLLFELHAEESRAILIVVTHSLELAGRFPRRFELAEGQCVEA